MKPITKTKEIYSQITYWLGVVVVGLAVGLSIQFAVAWQEPAFPPPGGNLEAPINVSDRFQFKKAGLMLNTSDISVNGLIVAKGNVGIGTTAPDNRFRLDVDGGMVVHDCDAINGTGLIDVTGDGVGTVFDAYSIINLDSFSRIRDHQNGTYGLTHQKSTGNFTINHSSSGTPLLSIGRGGNVGIGTANPSDALSVKLDVKGDIVAGNSNNLNKRLKIGTVLTHGEYNTLDDTSGPWMYFVDNVDSVWIDGSIGVRLGNQNSAKLVVGRAKNTYAPIWASNFHNASDQRYKKDIKTVSNAIDRINNIRGVDFKMRSNGEPCIGVIAQEVEKDFSSLVSENKYGYKLVNYNGFIGVLIEAVKEQQRQIEKLQEEVEGLKR